MGGVALTPNYTAYKQQSQDTNMELSDPSTVFFRLLPTNDTINTSSISCCKDDKTLGKCMREPPKCGSQ